MFNKSQISINMMKGWFSTSYSGIEGIQFAENLEQPTIKTPNDVLVEVHTATVNPIDRILSAGYGAPFWNAMRWKNGINEFPLIFGREFCGVVKGKGSAVREDIKIGDKVFGAIAPFRPGSLAEYVVVDQTTIAHKPEVLDDNEAAGILYSGLTAWASLNQTGLIKGSSPGAGNGKHICILGASGGVGTLALQMAKAENMKITAVCSTNSVQMVKELGADTIIDYKTDDLKEKVNGKNFDVVLDAAGRGSDFATTLPWTFGQYITLNSPALKNFEANGLVLGALKSFWDMISLNTRTLYNCRGRLKWGFFAPSPVGIEYLRKLVASGKVKPAIDSVFDFKSAKQAFQKKDNLRGKVIVKVK